MNGAQCQPLQDRVKSSSLASRLDLGSVAVRTESGLLTFYLKNESNCRCFAGLLGGSQEAM